jgi:hypothetical protein
MRLQLRGLPPATQTGGNLSQILGTEEDRDHRRHIDYLDIGSVRWEGTTLKLPLKRLSISTLKNPDDHEARRNGTTEVTRGDVKTEERQNGVILELRRVEAHIKKIFFQETEDRYCVWLQDILTRRSERLRRLFEAELLSTGSYERLLEVIKSLLQMCGGAQACKMFRGFRDVLRHIDVLSFDAQRMFANIFEAFFAPLNT